MEPVGKPRKVAWGRKEDDRAIPKRCKHTGEGKFRALGFGFTGFRV